jgi:hypothetical protein
VTSRADAVAAHVEEHYGAMHRLARLVGSDEARARDVDSVGSRVPK